MLSQNLVDGSLISFWTSKYPALARGVVNAASFQSIYAVKILTFWLESGCLKDFPSFRYIWEVQCSLGADITESHHFENESFYFEVHISQA